MSPDVTWLTQEAHQIHDWFQALFYTIVLVFLLLGIFIEYFKWPLGGVPNFTSLVGRALIAAILLNCYPEIANLISDITNGVSQHLGDLNQFKLVLDRLGDKTNQISGVWVSIKTSIIVLITYLCFFLLYFSVHVAQAFYLYTLVMLYIFSPILCALYVLPQTAPATSALFRSLIEVACWKPVWCVIATLLWSTGVSDITGAGSDVSFLSTVCFCLIAAGSLLMTPMVVHALASGGMTSLAQSLGSIPMAGVGAVTAGGALSSAMKMGKNSHNVGLAAASAVTSRYLPRVDNYLQKIPKFNVKKKPPVLKAQEPRIHEKPATPTHSEIYLGTKPDPEKRKKK